MLEEGSSLWIHCQVCQLIKACFSDDQGGITCGAIEDPRKSSKAIDERVIINFRDKNGVIARFRDKNVVIVRFCDKNVECLYIYYGVIEE